ncbi:hypothetical protein ADK57_44255 [Streptomyces sp. MMG1533]|uniref:hypothetical protein n=1 Tax=Streptomyces sp. MMG1533 TaxID=1415546 RepID=UPI0006B05738|nr:hypothetical protein [Streptomyces sp. MMG1533]KOU55514.1 hypothetical protein ADK57_44255 [Streptomyces sp. MMG1533]
MAQDAGRPTFVAVSRSTAAASWGTGRSSRYGRLGTVTKETELPWSPLAFVDEDALVRCGCHGTGLGERRVLLRRRTASHRQQERAPRVTVRSPKANFLGPGMP